MKNDPVNHPKHYCGHPSGVECIVITEKMDFCLGNAFKYLFRCGDKGNALEDLRKALWYVERALEQRRALKWQWNNKRFEPWFDCSRKVCQVLNWEKRYSGHMCAAMGWICGASACKRDVRMLERAVESIKRMIRIEQLKGEGSV